MRTIQTVIYKFNELNDDAKKKAIENYKNNHLEFHWMDENLESIKKGLEYFGFKVKDYSIDYLNANCSNVSFVSQYMHDVEEISGVRLWKYLVNNNFEQVLNEDCPFTGYCMDETFLTPIREFMKRPYDISFNDLMDECVWECLKGIQNDAESQMTDEYIIDFMEVNDYEFTEDGEIV